MLCWPVFYLIVLVWPLKSQHSHYFLLYFSVCLFCEYHSTVTAIISALISVVILSSREEN